MTTALSGLKVLDFTQMMTGPFATMMLGDSGADVIKVEQPDGDPFRRSGETTLNGDGAFFLGVNRNKRGIVLDLKTEAGRAAALALAAQADVLVENFRPGLTERAGLGYEDLRKINPRLVYCSISGFGRDGPDRNRPALDMVIQAVSGVMQVTGTEESGPLKTGFPFSDLVTALVATIGILVALQARERTGEGQRVDLSMLDASIFSQVPRDVYFDLTGKTPARMGNQHWDIVPNNTYATSDGRDIMIITINDKFWHVLCDALGASELKTDPRFATKAARLANRVAVDERLAAIFATRTLAEWEPVLANAGAIYGAVRTWPEVFSDPQVVDKLVRVIPHPKGGEFKVINNPLNFSHTPTHIRRAPPILGQHNDEVLGAGSAGWPAAD
ncbi:CoA transferase [Burkholderia multivorans]|uniref:CoA transferase n=1 Tax=Burkholderia multivorans TaxID=87883 RepID=A0AB37AWR6_9BURK|nr:CoA transferase [Burkholderia multivorans]MBU9346562.1 CoA transferase [Burkholderia multivorans]MCO1383856.1 CoA transferase [Burkholderia multivorans]MCO1400547.1 CoA transferase [Burkholderia multivorans]MDN7969732.1 CoA transferase [Burkholderia multivorans]PRE50434.1 CoA transferase [Burkholderia multivorans]